LALVLQAMKLAQSLQQACWPHQELLQLPHVDAALLKELASRKNKNEKGLLRTFAQLPAAERRAQLLGDIKTRGRPGHVGLTDQQADDVERVLASMPVTLSVDVTVKVEDEVAFISPLSIVSLFVRCARTTNTDGKPIVNVVTADADDVKALIAVGAKLKGSAARVAAAAAERVVSQKGADSTSSDATSAVTADDEETWQPDKEVTAKVIDEQAMPAHAPFLPDVVNERFWIVWGDPLRQLMWAVKKTNINPPGADNEVVKIVFQAPERPGKYSWALFVISDAYLGCDVKVDVNFVVHPAPELPPAVDEIFSDEEISLSDDEADDDDPDDDEDDKKGVKKVK